MWSYRLGFYVFQHGGCVRVTKEAVAWIVGTIHDVALDPSCMVPTIQASRGRRQRLSGGHAKVNLPRIMKNPSKSMRIHLHSWTASLKRPDLNPIENQWVILQRILRNDSNRHLSHADLSKVDDFVGKNKCPDTIITEINAKTNACQGNIIVCDLCRGRGPSCALSHLNNALINISKWNTINHWFSLVKLLKLNFCARVSPILALHFQRWKLSNPTYKISQKWIWYFEDKEVLSVKSNIQYYI